MTATIATTTWNIDSAHSSAEFKVRHMMISYVKGEFSGVSGMLELDEENYSRSTVEASIPVATLRTGNDDRDTHLKAADFLDVEKFPVMTFKSKNIRSSRRQRLCRCRRSDDSRRYKIHYVGRPGCQQTNHRSLGQFAIRTFLLGQD